MKKLLAAKLEIHELRVNELQKKEDDLIKLISETGNQELMDTFLDWQNLRSSCNDSFTAILSVTP